MFGAELKYISMRLVLMFGKLFFVVVKSDIGSMRAY